MNPGKDLCNFHPLPWKDTWNEPATIVQVITFQLGLFDILVNDESFIKKCTLQGQKKAESSLITKMMPRPLCCWVAKHYPEELEKIYREQGVEPPDAASIAINN